jgi:hypothetical protein
MTGEREQEVMFTSWSDVSFAASTVRVTHKPDRRWTSKAYKEREIPVLTGDDIGMIAIECGPQGA